MSEQMDPCIKTDTIDVIKVTLRRMDRSLNEYHEELNEVRNRLEAYAVLIKDLKSEITGNYSQQELKATLDFFISLGRVFRFFQKYKVFAVFLSLMIVSAVSGIGIVDIVEWLTSKGFWFK